MIEWKKTACALMALAACLMAGCSESEDSDSSSTAQTTSQEIADDDSQDDTESESNSEAEAEAVSEADDEISIGELLSGAAEIFDGDYTYTSLITYSDDDSVSYDVTLAKSGDELYEQIVTNEGDEVSSDVIYYFDGTTAYNLDIGLGIYSQTDEIDEVNTIVSVAQLGLDQTTTHIPDDTEGLEVEEYTYTGDTYITVFDFYFDDDGSMVKHTVTYIEEGEDDLVQTVETVKLDDTADEALFDKGLFDDLKDFDAMTEDERLSFCQSICSEYGISTDDMYTLDITTDDLKTISYDDFTTLVYTFA